MEYPEYTDKEKAFIFHYIEHFYFNRGCPYKPFFRLAQKFKEELEYIIAHFEDDDNEDEDLLSIYEKRIDQYLMLNNIELIGKIGTIGEFENIPISEFQYLLDEDEYSFSTYVIK
jgi:hypothetical protein